MLAPASDRSVARTDNSASPAVEAAKDAGKELSAFLHETPVIQNFDDCKQGDAWIERTRIALATMEDERKPQADPLNAKLETINKPYRLVRQPLEKLFDELKRRVSKFKNAVEAARIAEANRLRAEAEAKERAAREAEAREADAIAAVDVGVCEDVGNAIVEADASFRDFERANRQAATAEKNVPVRVASIVGGKALSMRTKRVLVIDDPCAAVKAMWPNERIVEAIKLAARDFKDAYGELPPGVTETFERGM